MKITEGIVWENKSGEWVKTLDAWPSGRRGARIFADNDLPFGQYGKNEAIELVEGWIASGKVGKYEKLGVIPGKEMSDESKGKLKEFTTKKKVERGEIEPVESYISKEDEKEVDIKFTLD